MLTGTPTPARLRLAVPSISVTGMPAERSEFFTEHFAGVLARAGADVTSPRQIAQVLGAERQRQLLGCSDGTSCLIELANALGSDGIVSAEIGQFDDVFQVNAKLISDDGRVLFSQQARAGNAEALLDRIDVIGAELASMGARLLSRGLTPAQAGAPWLPLSIAAFALGVGSEIVAVVMLLRSNDLAQQLRGTGPIDINTATRWAAEGTQANTVGMALAIGGGALLAAGGIFLGLEVSSRSSVALVPTGDGGHFVLTGRW